MTEVVEERQAPARALALAERLAGLPAQAVAMNKRVIDLLPDASTETALSLEALAWGMLAQTEDADEAARAFEERRKPDARRAVVTDRRWPVARIEGMALRALLAMLAAAASLVAAACGEDDEPPAAPLDSAGKPAVSEPAESDPAAPEAVESEPASTRLFLAGEGELAVVDVDTESTRVLQVDQLAAGDPPYRIVRRGNELVFYGGDTYAVDLAARDDTEKGAQVLVLHSGGRRGSSLGCDPRSREPRYGPSSVRSGRGNR